MELPTIQKVRKAIATVYHDQPLSKITEWFRHGTILTIAQDIDECSEQYGEERIWNLFIQWLRLLREKMGLDNE